MAGRTAMREIETPHGVARVHVRVAAVPRGALVLGHGAGGVDELRAGEFRDLPVVVGGRSSGARVACRTASEVGAEGVLCLAFPLLPPARRSADPSAPRPAAAPSSKP